MKTAVTNGLLFKTHSAEESLRIIKEAGFDGVALDLGRMLNPKYDQEGRFGGEQGTEEIKKLAAYAKELELEIAYAVAYTHDYHHDFEEVSFPLICRSIELAAAAGAPYVVVTIPHRGSYRQQKETLFPQYVDYLLRIGKVAEEQGVCIALKNTCSFDWGRYAQSHDVCSEISDMLAYLDTLNAQYPHRFWACVDSGVAYLVGYQPHEYVQALGARIKLLAINDNARRKNVRAIPGSSGHIDFTALTQALKDVGYQGFYTLDLSCNQPQELLSDHYAYAAKVARHYATL